MVDVDQNYQHLLEWKNIILRKNSYYRVDIVHDMLLIMNLNVEKK